MSNKTINYEKSNSLSLSLSNKLKPRSGSNTNPISHFLFTKSQKGFTIVELLVVIVVIGILAAITIVSYTGISQKAVASSIISNLDNAAKKLKLYQILYDSYPTTMVANCPTAPVNDTRYCLKSSPGETLTYTITPSVSTSPQAFRLVATNGTTSYAVTNSTTPTIAMATTADPSIGLPCPTGFIAVPGSGTYGTNDFCVMKYEAKDGGSSVPVSTAAGTPWVSISQTTAITNSQNVANCTGCHLITEAEYLTIAQNVLSVASNWNGGVVGNSYIYSGHNDNVPASALAVTNPADGYSDTGNVSGNQKRTLTLSNGEVIWDFAGNVWEWTLGTISTVEPGVTGSGYATRDWNSITNQGTILPNPNPINTGISGANVWDANSGIGQ